MNNVCVRREEEEVEEKCYLEAVAWEKEGVPWHGNAVLTDQVAWHPSLL